MGSILSDYLQFFAFTSEPFEHSAARSLVLETGPLRRAVSWIVNEIESGTPRLCLSGAAGVGKSSLSQALPHVLDHRIARIHDPSLSWKQIEKSFIEQFEVTGKIIGREVLQEARAASTGRLVGVVDAAERITEEMLGRLEALQNHVDDDGSPLVQLVFLADADSLGGPLRRVQPRHRFDPLLPRELRRYLEARLLNAGFAGDEIFPAEACHAIHHYTDGVPRRVDRLCRKLLEEAARWGTTVIQPDLVARMCGDADAAPAWKAPGMAIGRIQRQGPPSGASAAPEFPALRRAGGAGRRGTDLPAMKDPVATTPPAKKQSAPSAKAPEQRAPVEERVEPEPTEVVQPPVASSSSTPAQFTWPDWLDNVNWRRISTPAALVAGAVACIAVITAITASYQNRNETAAEAMAAQPKLPGARSQATAVAPPALEVSPLADREIETDLSTIREKRDFLQSTSRDAELLGMVPSPRIAPSKPSVTAVAAVSPTAVKSTSAPPATAVVTRSPAAATATPVLTPAAPAAKAPQGPVAPVAKIAPLPSTNPQPKPAKDIAALKVAAQKVAAEKAAAKGIAAEKAAAQRIAAKRAAAQKNARKKIASQDSDRELRWPPGMRSALRGPSASSAPPAKLDLPPPALTDF